MSATRVFVSQETLDLWMSEDRVEVDGETMTLKPERQRFRLTTAVHFLTEVADGGDDARLIGKVKALEDVAALGGEHCSDSVILGDSAYEVIEGFLGEPVYEPSADEVAGSGASLAAAAAAALGEGPPTGEIDSLTRFFLGSR